MRAGLMFGAHQGTPVVGSPEWSATDKSAGLTLSNGNLTASTVGEGQWVRSALKRSTGKRYWEVTVDKSAADTFIGFAGASVSAAQMAEFDGIGVVGLYTIASGGTQSTFYSDGDFIGAAGNVPNGGVVGFAVDLDARKFWLRINGAWTQGDPAAGTSGYDFPASLATGEIAPHTTLWAYSDPTGRQITANFGATAFNGPALAGFTAWNGNALSITPASYSGLDWWLDFTDSATWATAGTYVDKSSNARSFTQATEASRPAKVVGALNGLSVADFDGVNHKIVGPSDRTPTTFTIFVVAKHRTSPTASRTFVRRGSSNISYIFRSQTSNYIGGYVRNQIGTQVNVPNAPSSYGWSIFELSWDGTTVDTTQNGRLVTTVALSGTSVFENGEPIVIGSATTAGSDLLNGQIAEIFMYHGHRSAAERIALRGYIENKYGFNARTNMIADKDALDNTGTWNRMAGTIVVDQETIPGGAMTAERLYNSTAGDLGYSGVRQGPGCVSGEAYEFEVKIKANGAPFVLLYGDASAWSYRATWFNLATGLPATRTNSDVYSDAVAGADGWHTFRYRKIASSTQAVGSASYLAIMYSLADNNYNSAAGQGIFAGDVRCYKVS